MNVFLMFRDRDVGSNEDQPPNATELVQDLELETLFKTMASGDVFLLDAAKKSVLASLREPDAIVYRQQILSDCLQNPEVVRQMYGIAVEAIERERRIWGGMFANYPDGLLHRSLEVLQIFVELLNRLRHTAEEHAAKFRSEGFARFFSMLTDELSDEYLATIQKHMRQLEFRNGVLMTAKLGKGNKGVRYILRKPAETRRGWIDRLQSWMQHLTSKETAAYVYEVPERDEAGFRALAELKGMGIGHVAAALAQSTDHVLSFFTTLRLELGFYVTGLNLRDQLAKKGEPICFPEPQPVGTPVFSSRGLYDACLSLKLGGRSVGNDVAGNGKLLFMITGANRGGKSTFLRSAGLAQLMMQCGMFVPAESHRADVRDGIFTHFKREEDAAMKSGKLDEELSRMSTVIDRVRRGSIVLLNESFAATNEREGSEIARQIVRALLEAGVKVLYVTHMFALAQGLYGDGTEHALFLRAERLADGRRTFRLMEGEPLPTSYGEDLYARIFGDDREAK